VDGSKFARSASATIGMVRASMATATTDIVQKLWNLCTLLKEDGVTYHQYVTELTYLLFLKMMKEQKREDALPKGLRWDALTSKEGVEQLEFYKRLLLDMGGAKNRLVRDIYETATTTLTKPKTLAMLVRAFDELDWYSGEREGLGDLYEGLLEKNAAEVKSGALPQPPPTRPPPSRYPACIAELGLERPRRG
jgi:type I restriction enzyme M protein